MRRLNVIGPNVVRLRHQRNWTQEKLATKLQLLGCDITPQVVANIETGRCVATDTHIRFLVKVFRIHVADLFPPEWRDGRTNTGQAASPSSKKSRAGV